MTIRPDWINVSADHTPGPHRTDSDDLLWWLPILGPTASWLAFLLARHATHHDHTRWSVDTLTRAVGLGANQAKLWGSVERLDRFGVGCVHSTETLTVRLWLPALTPRHLDRLPPPLAATYPTHQ